MSLTPEQDKIDWVGTALLLMCFAFIVFGPLLVRHARQKQYHKIYDACIADGQKPYYCESLATR